MNIFKCDFQNPIDFLPNKAEKIQVYPNFVSDAFYMKISSEMRENIINNALITPITVFSFLKEEGNGSFLTLVTQKNCIIFEIDDETILSSLFTKFENTTLVPAKNEDLEEIAKYVDSSKFKFLDEMLLRDLLVDINILFDFHFPRPTLSFDTKLSIKRFLYISCMPLFSFFIIRNYYPTNSFEDKSFFPPPRKIPQKDSPTKKSKPKKFTDSDFIKLHVLGYGAKSVVKLGVHISTGYLYAVKTYSDDQMFKTESSCLSKFCHSRIVNCHGFIKQSLNKALILDFMSKGSLERMTVVDPTLKTKIVYQTLVAVDFLHSVGIMHRNIKPSNILLNRDNDTFLSGLALSREYLSSQKRSRNVGDVYYMSPEIIKGSDTYSFQTDLFSLGVIIYELSTGKNPYNGFCLLDVTKKVATANLGELPLSSGTISKLFEQCTSLDVADRAASFYLEKMFEEEHLFFANSNDVEILHFIEKIKQERIEYQDFVDQHQRKDAQVLIAEAEKGHSNAQHSVGFMYKNGWLVDCDLNKSFEWFSKAAEQGNSASMYEIGLMYKNGISIPRDLDKAYYWLKKASDLGLNDARNCLAELLQENPEICQQKNHSINDIFDLLKTSSDHGNPYAQCNLAKLYISGQIGQPNYEKAFEYFDASASQGNADAEFELYRLLSEGLGTEKDEARAAMFLFKAASHNRPDAMIEFGNLLINGKGVDKNEEEGRKWIEKGEELQKK
ncbi:hypothetical protein TRFO_04121 [Tritrichomonas foetus]|uniref:Protein kinase domain-containing protein n=1 Tax=Tritrichomonas foetus TaxID=1144522 RepID=A0A1J4KGU7_9EUKA|nr:hypothetical protein TRFO_04121 [Tritrichomonas foetus]|eukprot:OHT10631.1 hypothetical protein TRFO_04121 [Tritrichomonas foetus]